MTICTRERACLLGHAVNGEIRLNDAGEIARRCWQGIPDHFPLVELDASVIMPNHVHGIIVIHESCKGEKSFAPTHAPTNTTPTMTPQSPSRTIGSIVRGFKIVIQGRGRACPARWKGAASGAPTDMFGRMIAITAIRAITRIAPTTTFERCPTMVVIRDSCHKHARAYVVVQRLCHSNCSAILSPSVVEDLARTAPWVVWSRLPGPVPKEAFDELVGRRLGGSELGGVRWRIRGSQALPLVVHSQVAIKALVHRHPHPGVTGPVDPWLDLQATVVEPHHVVRADGALMLQAEHLLRDESRRGRSVG